MSCILGKMECPLRQNGELHVFALTVFEEEGKRFLEVSFVNESEKAIETFSFEVVCQDAEGNESEPIGRLYKDSLSAGATTASITLEIPVTAVGGLIAVKSIMFSDLTNAEATNCFRFATDEEIGRQVKLLLAGASALQPVPKPRPVVQTSEPAFTSAEPKEKRQAARKEIKPTAPVSSRFAEVDYDVPKKPVRENIPKEPYQQKKYMAASLVLTAVSLILSVIGMILTT